jgi:hypothetical protein
MKFLDYIGARTKELLKASVKTDNSVGMHVTPVILGFCAIVFFVVIYYLGRPLLYYEKEDYRQKALQSVAASIRPLLPDANFDAGQIPSLMKQVDLPIHYSIGIFAVSKVPIKVDSVQQTGNRVPEIIYMRGANWTANAFLTIAADPPVLQYNWDIIILAAGSIIVLVAGVSSFSRSPPLPSLANNSAQIGSALNAPSDEYLAIDVQRALATSEQLFSRSTLLLVGGVVMAFIGVGVFFMSLRLGDAGQVMNPIVDIASIATPQTPQAPQSTAGFSATDHLLFAFRSFAMLIFIEAIAWFLLRQYRSLIEDYKSFYRHYMRRANYLAAVKLSDQKQDKELYNKIIETLLAEDLTGRMNKDQTTDTLEGQKLIDANFAETVFSKWFELMQTSLKLISEKSK